MPACSVVRRAATLLAAAGALLAASATTASAAPSVAYLDAHEVWVANLDGSGKTRLSTGQGDWTAVAQSKDGWIVGIQLEAGKISQLSHFTVWNPQGVETYHGPLPAHTDAAIATYPLSLALTTGGGGIVYTYSEYGSLYSWARTGYIVLPSTTAVAPALGPISFATSSSPSEYVALGPDDRVFLTGGAVVGARQAYVQAPGGIGTDSFSPWMNLSAAPNSYSYQHLAVSANDGSTYALEIYDDQGSFAGSPTYIDLGRATGFGGAGIDDCLIEQKSTTRTSHPTLSPDGTTIAWQDTGGVKLAGVPNFAPGGPATCAFASGPITLSATASYPSIGGFDLGAYLAARAPSTGGTGGSGGGSTGTGGGAGGGSTGTGAGGSGSDGSGTGAPTLTAKLSGTPKISTATSTLAFKLTPSATGKATLKLSILPKALGLKGKTAITLGTGSGAVKRGASATIKVKLTARAKSLRKRLKGKKASLGVTVGGQSTTITVKLG